MIATQIFVTMGNLSFYLFTRMGLLFVTRVRVRESVGGPHNYCSCKYIDVDSILLYVLIMYMLRQSTTAYSSIILGPCPRTYETYSYNSFFHPFLDFCVFFRRFSVVDFFPSSLRAV